MVTHALCYRTELDRSHLVQINHLNSIIRTSRDQANSTFPQTKLVRYWDLHCLIIFGNFINCWFSLVTQFRVFPNEKSFIDKQMPRNFISNLLFPTSFKYLNCQCRVRITTWLTLTKGSWISNKDVLKIYSEFHFKKYSTKKARKKKERKKKVGKYEKKKVRKKERIYESKKVRKKERKQERRGLAINKVQSSECQDKCVFLQTSCIKFTLILLYKNTNNFDEAWWLNGRVLWRLQGPAVQFPPLVYEICL